MVDQVEELDKNKDGRGPGVLRQWDGGGQEGNNHAPDARGREAEASGTENQVPCWLECRATSRPSRGHGDNKQTN